jgi:cytochrome P450
VGDAGMLIEPADIERLKYIEAVTHETMRLKPVAPVVFLESNEDVEIGGVSVPKETAVLLAHVARRLAGQTLWCGGPVPTRTLARSSTGFRLSSQCEGVHSLWGGSAFLSGPSTGHGGDQDGHGHAVRRVRGLEDRTAPASRRDFFVHDDAGKSVRAF